MAEFFGGFAKGMQQGLAMQKQHQAMELQRKRQEQAAAGRAAQEAYRARQAEIANRRVEIQERQLDMKVTERFQAILTDTSMHPEARSFLLDELVQASGYDTKSERYKGLKKLLLTMPEDQASALADAMASSLPNTQPGEVRQIIGGLIQGGISPADIPKILSGVDTSRARQNILGDVPGALGLSEEEGDEAPLSDVPGTVVDGLPALAQDAGMGAADPQEFDMSPTALRDKARQLGAAGDFEGMRTVLQMARDVEGKGGPTTNIEFITERKEAEKLAERDFSLAGELDNDLAAAKRSENSIKAFEIALDGGRFTPGAFSGIRQSLSQIAEFVGMDPESPAMKMLLGTGDPASAEAMHAASNRLALDLADKLSKMTNMSLAFVQESVPNLARTPDGNRLIIDMIRAGNARTVEAHNMMERFLSDYGTLRPQGKRSFFQEVQRLYEKPLFDDDFVKRVQEESRKGAGVDITGGIDELNQGPPTINSIEDLNKLAPGTRFIWGPNNKPYTKD